MKDNSCPIGHLVDSAAERGQSFSERMKRSEIPQRSEDHYWGFAPVKRRYLNIVDFVGNTPLIKVCPYIYAKAEFFNPAGSIKDRVAKQMIFDAIKSKKIDKNSVIIEPTSGNTGIGLAFVCAKMGIKAIIVMPESMSIERRKIISSFGAKVELSPSSLGMKGAIKRAKELNRQIKNSIILDQFSNPSNPKAHKQTAKEILKDLKKIDIFVAGVGTGGTISGVGEVLKKRVKNIKIVALEPKNSAILSGKKPGIHKIEGIGAGFVPKVLNTKIIDKVITISDEEAFLQSQKLAKSGIFAGISSGANIAGAKKLLKMYPKKNIVTILPDTKERYLSLEGV
jgi:cysteine synthase A